MALITETLTYVACPHCGERAGRIDHLFGDKLPRSWGPWSCEHCGRSYAGTVISPTEVSVETRPDEPLRIKTLDLLKIPASDKPVFIVVHNSWREGDEHIAYYYDEHTCPTNWIANIEAFIEDGDTDPHGVAEFVRSVPFDSEDEPDLEALFPEAFDGPIIEGEANKSTKLAPPHPTMDERQ